MKRKFAKRSADVLCRAPGAFGATQQSEAERLIARRAWVALSPLQAACIRDQGTLLWIK
jgi:hypothetical protein